MNTQVRQKVRRLAAELFDVPVAKITDESTPESLENWDSVQQLNLVLALQDEFGIVFEPEDFEKMRSIGQLSELVETKLG